MAERCFIYHVSYHVTFQERGPNAHLNDFRFNAEENFAPFFLISFQFRLDNINFIRGLLGKLIEDGNSQYKRL